MPKTTPDSRRHKQFGAPKTTDDFEPLSFSLGEKEFECHPAINGATLLEYIEQLDGADGAASARALREFFSVCMDVETFSEFWAMVQDPDLVFQIADLSEIAGWLVGEYTDRPKAQSKPSSGGRSRAGTASTESASSEA